MRSSSKHSGVGLKWTLLSLLGNKEHRSQSRLSFDRKAKRARTCQLSAKPTRDEIERNTFAGHAHKDAWSKRLDKHSDVRDGAKHESKSQSCRKGVS